MCTYVTALDPELTLTTVTSHPAKFRIGATFLSNIFLLVLQKRHSVHLRTATTPTDGFLPSNGNGANSALIQRFQQLPSVRSRVQEHSETPCPLTHPKRLLSKFLERKHQTCTWGKINFRFVCPPPPASKPTKSVLGQGRTSERDIALKTVMSNKAPTITQSFEHGRVANTRPISESGPGVKGRTHKDSRTKKGQLLTAQNTGLRSTRLCLKLNFPQ